MWFAQFVPAKTAAIAFSYVMCSSLFVLHA